MPRSAETARRIARGHDGFLRERRKVALYDYQREWRDRFFELAITRSANDLYLEMPRQSGKTLIVVESVAYLIGILDILLGRPAGIGFFAPRYEQAKTDWDRVKDVMPDVADFLGLEPREENAHTMTYFRPQRDGHGNPWSDGRTGKAATMYAFSLGETTKLESKTLDIAIVEEAHEVDDRKVAKEVLPMLTATNGFVAYIGVAGYRLCNFKRGIEESPRSFVFRMDRILGDRKKAHAETADPSHLEYEKFYKAMREKTGNVLTDEIRTQYLLEWVTERGNFISRKSLEKCKRKFLCVRDPDIVVGIDFGKHTDRTVATASTVLGQRLCSLELLGSNYTLQVPAIKEWIQGELAGKGWNVVAIVPDSTGAGDVVTEMLERAVRWPVDPFVFSSQSKAQLYQSFSNLLAVAEGIADGAVEDTGQRRFEYWAGDPNVARFEQETLDLEREYVGDKQLLSCHHPEKAGAHDDHCDSTALAVAYERQSVSVDFV